MDEFANDGDDDRRKQARRCRGVAAEIADEIRAIGQGQDLVGRSADTLARGAGGSVPAST